jgi:hypothetical protein
MRMCSSDGAFIFRHHLPCPGVLEQLRRPGDPRGPPGTRQRDHDHPRGGRVPARQPQNRPNRSIRYDEGPESSALLVPWRATPPAWR